MRWAPTGLQSLKWKGDCNLAGLFGVENLAALVVSTFGTRTVRHLLLVAVRTLRERVWREKVVSAATRGASLRVPPFWIRHGSSSLLRRIRQAGTHKIILVCS